MLGWLPLLVARIPAPVHAKLLVAFLVIVGLLLVVGGVALRALSEVNERAEHLVQLQRKIAAYRQLQHDTTAQLYSVASALLVSDERSLDMILRQLNQFGYDLDRLQFVTRDEVELFGRVRAEYDEFIQVVTQVVRLIRAGRPAEGRELQQTQARPLADRLERLTNQLVNRAESAPVQASHDGASPSALQSRRATRAAPCRPPRPSRPAGAHPAPAAGPGLARRSGACLPRTLAEKFAAKPARDLRNVGLARHQRRQCQRTRRAVGAHSRYKEPSPRAR